MTASIYQPWTCESETIGEKIVVSLSPAYAQDLLEYLNSGDAVFHFTEPLREALRDAIDHGGTIEAEEARTK